MPKTPMVKLDEMTERQFEISELRLHGLSQEKIAKRLGISQQLVSREMRRVLDIWKDRMALSYDEHVAAAMARYDQLSEALKPKVDSGSIQAVDVAIRLEDRRARLLGIDKPVEQKVTISIEAIDNRIAELEAKAAGALEQSDGVELDYIEGEVVGE